MYYDIEGTSNKHQEQKTGAYLDPAFWPNWDHDLEKFKCKLIHCRDNRINFSLIRISHSEITLFYFMSGVNKIVGNWERQSKSFTFSPELYNKFFQSLKSVDFISTQLGYDFKNWLNDVKNYYDIYTLHENAGTLNTLLNNRRLFLNNHKTYDMKQLIDLPMDIVYGLIANKWFFKTFKNKIGLIGSSTKLNVIKDLMQFKEYQEYLGTDIFTDYVMLPEKKAMDNPDLESIVSHGIKNSSCDLFLIGAGTSKLKFYHLLKSFNKSCIYIDVGHGIDVIAGHCNLTRPYFGSWQNYRTKNSNPVDKMYGTGLDGDVRYLEK